jgi:hypothetical protein
VLLATGCTRRFYRQRADADTSALLTEKNQFEAWKIEQFHVYPDKDARFADPTDPDHPPMPPDDPAARWLSPNPYRFRHPKVAKVEGSGYLNWLAAWDDQNRLEESLRQSADSESGQAKNAYSASQNGNEDGSNCGPPYLIKLEQSSELGLFNSREFQNQRENLYRAALPVSLARFSFMAQFFSTNNLTRQVSGPESTVGAADQWSNISNNGFTRLFPTGATLMFNLANQLVFNFLAGNTSSISTMSIDLAQPFLRGGGLPVNLENLTQAERNLLYQIRAYARFRKEFYVNIAGGGTITGGAFVPNTTAALNVNTTPRAGYLPSVLRAILLQADQDNVKAFDRYLDLFAMYEEGGQVTPLQVDQVRQQLLQGRSTVLTDEQQLRDSLDSFKIQLGLPTDLPLRLDMSALDPVIEHMNRYQKALDQFEAARETAEKYDGYDDVAKLRDRLRTLL